MDIKSWTDFCRTIVLFIIWLISLIFLVYENCFLNHAFLELVCPLENLSIHLFLRELVVVIIRILKRFRFILFRGYYLKKAYGVPLKLKRVGGQKPVQLFLQILKMLNTVTSKLYLDMLKNTWIFSNAKGLFIIELWRKCQIVFGQLRIIDRYYSITLENEIEEI